MTVNEFAQTLLMRCEDEESTASVEALLARAVAFVDAGQGHIAFQSGAENGQSFTASNPLSWAEVERACREAIRFYNGTESPQVTVPDFSRMTPGGC